MYKKGDKVICINKHDGSLLWLNQTYTVGFVYTDRGELSLLEFGAFRFPTYSFVDINYYKRQKIKKILNKIQNG